MDIVEKRRKHAEYCKGYYRRNKEKHKAAAKRWRLNNRQKHRDYARNCSYGLKPGEYAAMYAAQNGLCNICGIHKETLCVDHNHTTDKVRKLLCGRCNVGLSWVERPGWLDAALTYLKQF